MTIEKSSGPLNAVVSTGRRHDAPFAREHNSHSRDGVSLAEIASVLRRHFRAVAGGGILGLAAAAAVIVMQPREYRATAVVRLTDPRRSIVQGLEDPTERAESQRISPLQSEIQLLRSRAVVGAVVDSEGLRLQQKSPRSPQLQLSSARTTAGADEDTLHLSFDSTGVTAHNRTSTIASANYGDTVRMSGASFVVPARPTMSRATLLIAPREKTSDWLLNNLKVAPRLETDVVDVSFTHGDAAAARRIVNKLVDVFREASVRAAQAQSRRRREFLQDQLQEIGLQLGKSERGLVDFRSRQHAYSSRTQLEAQQNALMSLDMRREELDADRRMYQSLLGRMEKVPGDTSADMRTVISAQDLSSNPVIAQLYERLAQYENTRDSLTTGEWRSAATSPDVVRLNSLVKSSQERLVGAVRGHVSALDARLSALDDLRTRSATSISTMPSTESAETQLLRQVETNRTMQDHLREEYQKARMAEEVEAGRVEVVDFAALPYKPIPNLLGLKLAFGLFAGLVTGGSVVLVRDRLSGSIRRRHELEDHVGVPALAIIPNISARLPSRRRFALAVFGDRPNADGERAVISGSQAAALSLAGSEAYRLLHANICWLQGTQQLKTIVVASALPGEGKTTVAANLAITFALEGRRTLLVDADLRRPRVHRTFHVARAPGVAQCLAGYVDASSAIRTTFVDGLYVLPAGHAEGSPTPVLRANPMRALVNECAENFDVVIVDTPPIFVAADAAIVGPIADGVLFVVRAGSTESDAAHQAFKQISGVGARVIGAVLNDPNGEAGQYGDHYGSYGYTAGYAGSVGAVR